MDLDSGVAAGEVEEVEHIVEVQRAEEEGENQCD